jgi:hypothetical protein
MLQYNKLYQSLKKVSAEWHANNVLWDYSWKYLKFYEDGTVINCVSNGDIENINEWFVKGNRDTGFSIGKYSIVRNNFIEINLPAMIGVIKMDGLILKYKLILRSSNNEMNLFEHWDEYSIANILV